MFIGNYRALYRNVLLYLLRKSVYMKVAITEIIYGTYRQKNNRRAPLDSRAMVTPARRSSSRGEPPHDARAERGSLSLEVLFSRRVCGASPRGGLTRRVGRRPGGVGSRSDRAPLVQPRSRRRRCAWRAVRPRTGPSCGGWVGWAHGAKRHSRDLAVDQGVWRHAVR